jgi:lipopolysaccharide/colanic/teichoic acid biosynthesis glycosyltransferase
MPLWLPLIIVIAVLVRTRLGAPVFFTQRRPGREGRPFTLVKFRTMTDARDRQGQLRSDADRLTGLGKLLRSWSLDELPELFNVLTGSMSLVGPRPLLVDYLPRYSAEEMRRHDVMPGLTGWAQVHGRNDMTWQRKFELDLWYVDHWSLWLDLRVLAISLVAVVLRRGIAQTGQATAEEFKGNADTTSRVDVRR